MIIKTKNLKKAEEIYNNTIHTSTKLEPIKAFKLTDENDINNIIQNILKSQAKVFKNINIISKGEKCLLNEIYLKKEMF